MESDRIGQQQSGSQYYASEAIWLVLIGLLATVASTAQQRRLGSGTNDDGSNIQSEDRVTFDVGPSDDKATPRWTDILSRTYASFDKDRILAVSAGITFYSLLALFPAIAALIALYSLFADASLIEDHLQSLAVLLPGGAIEIIGSQINHIASKGPSTLGFTFFVGLAISLWSSNAGMKALIDGLNIAYEVRESRGFIKLNVISVLFTLAAISCFLLTLCLVIAVPIALNFVGLGSRLELVWTFARWPALLMTVILALAVLYRFGTSPRGARWRWITPGSLLAGIIWLGASFGFSYYAANFGSYNETYGSLGGAIGFMTWIWMSVIVILSGAELNFAFETARNCKN